MSDLIEHFAIVEMKRVIEMNRPDMPALAQPVIATIIRTYLSRQRAGEDIDLLRQYGPTTSSFEIVAVEHIDA